MVLDDYGNPLPDELPIYTPPPEPDPDLSDPIYSDTGDPDSGPGGPGTSYTGGDYPGGGLSYSDLAKFFSSNPALSGIAKVFGSVAAGKLADKLFNVQGGPGGYKGGIPTLTASRQMLPIPTTMQNAAGQTVARRPGSGGISYFSPMRYLKPGETAEPAPIERAPIAPPVETPVEPFAPMNPNIGIADETGFFMDIPPPPIGAFEPFAPMNPNIGIADETGFFMEPPVVTRAPTPPPQIGQVIADQIGIADETGFFINTPPPPIGAFEPFAPMNPNSGIPDETGYTVEPSVVTPEPVARQAPPAGIANLPVVNTAPIQQPQIPGQPISQDDPFYQSAEYKAYQNDPSNMYATADMYNSPYFGQMSSGSTGRAMDAAYEKYKGIAPRQNQMSLAPFDLSSDIGNRFAAGGIANLGSYSDGGRLLRGPGDGVSDSIPAMIGKRQPARLADGEFVIPARIVSELGNGSTEAGARKLYAMMDRIKKARSKAKNIAADTKADKHLPA